MTRQYCPLTLAKDQMHHPCFGALLDSISTHPHRPRECSHLEHMPLSLKIMHWVLGTKILNSNDSQTNIRICMCLYPRSILKVAKRNCFQSTWTKLGHMDNWSTSMCSRPIIVQEGTMDGESVYIGWRPGLALSTVPYFIMAVEGV